jgi:hypothetical protein
VSGDVRARGNPVRMHVLKLGKVVDEIAEHVVEKRVRRDLLIQHLTVPGSVVRSALLVMKHAACPSTQELNIVYDIV